MSTKKYFSLIKFSHTLFALPFAIVGFFLALKMTQTQSSWTLLLKVVLCMVFARSAAMAFNRYLDAGIDALNPRTAVREIPSGKISKRAAGIFVSLNAILFVFTCYWINSLCFYLSPVALFVVFFYSYTKRFTALCHLVLGIGLALAPVGAFIAVTGWFHIVPVLFGFAVVFWVAGFDIIYALQDIDFDKKNKLKSIPVLLGVKNALNLARVFHFMSLLMLYLPSLLIHLDLFYWIGYVLFLFLLLRQHSIVSPHNLGRINIAFFTLNGIASVVFAICFLLDLYC